MLTAPGFFLRTGSGGQIVKKRVCFCFSGECRSRTENIVLTNSSPLPAFRALTAANETSALPDTGAAMLPARGRPADFPFRPLTGSFPVL